MEGTEIERNREAGARPMERVSDGGDNTRNDE